MLSQRLPNRHSDSEESREHSHAPAAEAVTPTHIKFLYVMWFFVWYDPDWFVKALGVGPVLVKLYAFMFIPVVVLLFKHGRREGFFWPYAVFVALCLVWMPFIANRLFLINAFLKLVQYQMLTWLTVSILESPKQVVPLLKLFLFHFLWFGAQGLPTQGVVWHNNLANEDSYGPFMTIGLAYAYYLAMGTTVKKYRLWAFGISLLGMAGTVMSFARGAMLSLCLVFCVLGIRSKKKLQFLGAGFVLVLVGLLVINLAFPNGEFWAEMGTITEEGNSSGTGEHRWVMWMAAVEVFWANPIVGVGPGNFGPNAAEYYLEKGVMDLGSSFDTPEKLYMMALHNDYVTTLVEQGIVGIVGLLATVIYFFRWLWILRRDPAREAWNAQAGTFVDAQQLSLGLEAAMIGFLSNSFFYNQYYIDWVWSLVMLAFVSASVAQKAARTQDVVGMGSKPLRAVEVSGGSAGR